MTIYLVGILITAAVISVVADNSSTPAPRRFIALGAVLWPILVVALLELGLVVAAAKVIGVLDAATTRPPAVLAGEAPRL